VILAIDGLQPDMGHEVLWVIRECQSGELLLARTLLSARHQDLAELLKQVKQVLQLPIAGVISDGQQSIRQAVKTALPEVAHALCHFHYLREAAKGIYEADRHAKRTEKTSTGIRAIEHSVSNDDNLKPKSCRYCLAVRSALTDDGRPPLDASGLQLKRLTQIQESLERLEQKGLPKPLVKLKSILVKGLETTASLWSPIAVAYNWVHQAAKFWITNQDLNCTLCVLL